MHGPYRIAAPPPPERLDPALDAYEAFLRERAGGGRYVMLFMSCAVVALWLGLAAIGHRAPSARAARVAGDGATQRVARARTAIASASSRAEGEQARFQRAVLAAIDAGIRPSAKGCATTLPDHPLGLSQSRAFPLLVVAKGDRDLPSPSLAPILARARRAADELERGRPAEAIAAADGLVSVRPPTFDVVLVTSDVKHPVRTTGSSFAPGEVSGRAYLYDHARHDVTCAGDIHAVSSSSIAYSFVPGVDTPASLDQGPRLASSLERDLEVQVEHAIARGSLFAVD